MTISYAGEVPNGSSFGCFWPVLRKWRGSVYKLVWRELLAYLCVYFSINLVYRYALNEDQQRIFHRVRRYFGTQSESIPMSFVLGFYVTLIVKRWWEQYKLLPWPDTLALFISAAIPGNNEIGRMMRRNIMRYMILAYVITLQRISLRVKRRFPTAQHLVDAGLMMESERKIFEAMNSKSPMSKYWMPLVWATNIINRARKDNLISSDHIVQTILMELSDVRKRLGALIGYDTVCVPLVYTQVVTLVLYVYFMAALMGKQMIPPVPGMTGTDNIEDLYFPLFTALQFVFYVGWLKVAEVLINPFGEDDDDIELNWLIDRHIKAAYMIVDEMHEEHPELLKDQYWEEVVPKDLPYTIASEHYRRYEPKGSAEHFRVKQSDAMYANIIPASKRLTVDDAYADYESVDTPIVERRKNWFSRQFNRMGSARSQSTAYSSGGLFNRNRLNSVYANPENGLPLHHGLQPSHKMSLYDRFVSRKSLRNQKQLFKQHSKLNMNGSVGGIGGSLQQRNRPRIPTPDVTKESIEKENKMNLAVITPTPSAANSNSVASGVALMAHQLAHTPAMFSGNNTTEQDVPLVGTIFLSPIKELDSAHSTLHAGHPATAALAQSILPKIQNSGFAPITTTTATPGQLESSQISNASFPSSLASNNTSDSQLGSEIVPIVPKTLPIPIVTTKIQPSTSPTPRTRFNNEIVLTGNSPPPIPPPLNRSNSTGSITKLVSDTTGGTVVTTTTTSTPLIDHNNLHLDNDKRQISKAGSDNNLNLNLIDSYHLERKYSDGSKPSDIVDNSQVKKSTHTVNNLNKKLQSNLSDISVSAPSTLTKRKPEAKTGEVYV